MSDLKAFYDKYKILVYNLRESYFLTDNDSSLSLLSNTYVDIERINKDHINDVMEMCNSSQKEEFRILIRKNSFFTTRNK
jgi:hypothetical protein